MVSSASTDHGQSSVSDEPISGCVAPLAFRLKIVKPLDRDLASCLYITYEFVSLGINIRRDMVCEVSVRVADAYADVVRGCANPYRPSRASASGRVRSDSVIRARIAIVLVR